RSLRYEKSGRTRSTPRCSSRGNARPASTTTISSSSSYTVRFFPTSPRPPSGVILKTDMAGSISCGQPKGGARFPPQREGAGSRHLHPLTASPNGEWNPSKELTLLRYEWLHRIALLGCVLGVVPSAI